MKLTDERLFQKKLGSLLGAVIGDAMGWPYEDRSMRINKLDNGGHFHSWMRRSGGRWYAHEEKINKGEYSDDSQLLFSTARSLKHGTNWAKYFAKVELPAWLLYERGGGGATKRAAQSWSKGTPPWKTPVYEARRYFEAGGNGVAMRILPHLLVSNDKESIFSQVFINGINTHGHPRALLGAILYAHALHYLFNKNSVLEYGELIDYLLETKSEWSKVPVTNKMDDWLRFANEIYNGKYFSVWEETAEEIVKGLLIAKEAMNMGILDNSNATLVKLGCFNKDKGAGTISAVVSIYIVSKYASNPSSGLLEVATLKNADTDTLASMVGGLIGALYGTDWIKDEWINELQDYKYIMKLADQIGTVSEEEKEIKLWSHQASIKFKDLLKHIGPNETILFGPFNQIGLLQSYNHKVLVKNYEIVTYKFVSEEGQTLFFKSINKLEYPKDDQSKSASFDKQKKANDKDLLFQLGSSDLLELSDCFPMNFRAKRALLMLSEISKGLEKAKNNNEHFNEKFVQKFSAAHVQKGIDLNTVYNIVILILKKKKLI